MTLGDMITAARIQARLDRRKQLDAQLLALMSHGTRAEPQNREEFYRWVEQVENVRAEIAAMETES